ncbi:hypothetical protein H6F32_07150 [Anabaena sp. FACHB-1237]|uniref:hypothetical protein n=1 Tax=Anabaena sp. FACHB-1237 TaxID=2692769 RepID=UPI001681A90C|nr:hypothetical protein [Anabaena sp. FACHB-1237]MBD2137366.1 hypothetical protein [Anabaena sp. FACHB-1237]
MFYGLIEQELSDGEPWSQRQQTQLPTQIQILIEQEQVKPDIWELPKAQMKKYPTTNQDTGLLKRPILACLKVKICIFSHIIKILV